MQRRIPVAGPWITAKEIEYVTDAVVNAWYSNATLYQQRFEKAFASYEGVQFAMALPSCTSAIHLALLALGIGPGDEVIVPDATWIATSAPITYVGATPVFADINPDTWCLSAESFERCITARTRAVIPVDLYGNIPNMDAICDIAERRRIAVIEDAAEAVGGLYKGKRAGSFGELGVFSFHGTKTLTTGEGGMLVTNNEELYQRANFLRNHGRSRGERLFYNTEIAYKYNMSSLQAALGLAQLERIDELLEHKREIYEWYRQELSEIDGLTLNYEESDVSNVYWMVTVILDKKLGKTKEDIIRLLGEKCIDTRPFFYPLSSLPAYAHLPQAKAAQQQNRVSYQICPYGVNLPSALSLDEEEVRYVCDNLKAVLNL